MCHGFPVAFAFILLEVWCFPGLFYFRDSRYSPSPSNFHSGLVSPDLDTSKDLSFSIGRKGSEKSLLLPVSILLYEGRYDLMQLCFKSSSVPWLLRMEVFFYQKTDLGGIVKSPWQIVEWELDSYLRASQSFRTYEVVRWLWPRTLSQFFL